MLQGYIMKLELLVTVFVQDNMSYHLQLVFYASGISLMFLKLHKLYRPVSLPWQTIPIRIDQ